jgi:PAS domain S-box-containing protein
MDYQSLSKEELINELEKLHQDMQDSPTDIPSTSDPHNGMHIVSLVDNIHEPIWSVDREYKIQIGNAYFRNLFKSLYGIEFEPGDNFIRFVPIDHQELWNGFFERALRGENFNVEQEYVTDEQTLYYDFTFNPIENAEGTIEAVAILGRETTERKISELRVRESEKRFRSLVQNSNDIIFVLTADGTIRYISPSVEQILGYTSADITNTDILMYLHPEDSDALQTHFNLCMNNTTHNLSFRCRFRRSDGSFAHIEGISNNLIDDEYIKGIVVNARDVTERIGVEEALLESERRFRSVVEDLPAMICRFLPDGTLTFVNGNYCNSLKRTAGELLGKSFLLFIPEDEREVVRKKYLSLSRNNPVITYEHRVELPTSEVRWQQWTDRVILGPDGQPSEYQSIGEDITERKIIEQQLHLLGTALEAAANAVLITDRKGIIMWINPAFTRLTGYTEADIIGQNPRKLKSGKHEDPFYKQLWDTVLSGEVWHGEMINRRMDGTLFKDRTTITPVSIDEKGITHFIAIKEYRE